MVKFNIENLKKILNAKPTPPLKIVKIGGVIPPSRL
jgi:hypothetical protein